MNGVKKCHVGGEVSKHQKSKHQKKTCDPVCVKCRTKKQKLSDHPWRLIKGVMKYSVDFLFV
jgi:hypothetical protein